MLKSKLAGIAALLAITLGSNANAATFISTRTVPTNSIIGIGNSQVDLSITTDGTIGVLTSANITSFTVRISNSRDALDDFIFTSGNSYISLIGNALSETATSLTFDFGTNGANLFQFVANSADSNGFQHFYCFETGGACTGNNSTGEAIFTRANRAEYSNVARTGIADLGTVSGSVSAVPEPATWAMMILGFGIAGASLRRRRVRLAAA